MGVCIPIPVSILALQPCLISIQQKAIKSLPCQKTSSELQPQTSQTRGVGGCRDLTRGDPECSHVSKRLLIRRGHRDVFGSLSEADMRQGLLRRNVCRKVLEREIEDTLPTILHQARVDRMAKRVASELKFTLAVARGQDDCGETCEKKVVARVGTFLRRKGISDIVLALVDDLIKRSTFEHWKDLLEPAKPLHVDIELPVAITGQHPQDTMVEKLQSMTSIGQAFSLSTSQEFWCRFALLVGSIQFVTSCEANSGLS